MATSIPPPPSYQKLEAALLAIAERQKLFWTNAANYKKLAVIEGCAHELAHALDLGPAFEDLLQTLSDEVGDKHEAATLRIEAAALAMLGVRLSMRRLRASANWNDVPPACKKLQAPLNRHELRCVRRFVVLVTCEQNRKG